MKKNIILFFALIQTLLSIGQNTQFLVRGKVNEKLSQEVLIGATIRILGSNQSTAADAFGLFSLYVSQQNCRVVASYLGYASDTIAIDASKDVFLEFELSPVVLKEVLVTANQAELRERLNSIALPMQQIKKIPALLGEPDVMRALTMLPGVSNGTEGSVGLNVRGGSPDQNLILLDGAAIYNASHLFGFLSTFNADAIKRVELLKGSFPARYGGRLSSVIDINFKDGNKEKKNFEIGLGIIASKIFIEGPIRKERSSFMFAARSSYLDLFTAKSKKDFYQYDGRKYMNYNLYDINGKVNFLIGKTGSLSLGIFRGNDNFINASKPRELTNSENTIRWNNTIGNIRYVQPLNKKIIFNTQLTYNNYNYNFAIKNIIDKTKANRTDYDINIENTSITQIYDLGHKSNVSWIVSDKMNVSFGLELLRQYFKPNVFKTILENVDLSQNSTQNTNFRKSFNTALFTDINVKWNKHFGTTLGVRYSNYAVENSSFNFFEPRISFDYELNKNNSIKANFTVMNQPIHLLSNNSLGFTNDAWIPATRLAPPENAIQYALGYVRNLPSINSYVAVEAFYKNMKNLIDYTEASNPTFDNATKGYENIIQKNGKGEAFGLEFLLHKETGKLNWIIEYTLSKTRRRFEKINFGRWYNARFDRTHDLGLTLNYDLTKRWSVSSSFLFSTGTPVSGPSALILTTNEIGTDQFDIFTFYSGKNNIRLPNYHRMDIGLNYTKTTKRGNQNKWSFGAYNVYNRENVIAVSYIASEQKDDNIILGSLSKRSLFPFVPYLTYSFKLK